ncbi:MAG: (2Fe-2S) ferredoxin domain-containing protein [Drouetiella hepatica Uher 2000/2452]|jgi:(2Fe-2S) ferredoxin|uniref:(2Fe-2S) ferredoxin domain-containing protein n=1 Tax=Drouetiella hepatica Uher 2000/2452 TaxID=904376 RepID=A0A951QDS4_9CYAN|nr:(2Fe-2S) ferredoxin domain-containing protein [Drouetiella hepatica Uher 2000/2452]
MSKLNYDRILASQQDRQQDFQLEGRFLGFAAEPGSYKLKYLRIATATGEQQIKLAKELRSSLYRDLTPGDWIQVQGCQKFSSKPGIVKLKAYQVTAAIPKEMPYETTLPSNLYPMTSFEIAPAPQIASPSACILMCQKSDCCKRGSREVAKALQAELSDRGLPVTIKATGCMKRCKEGANVVMPDKTRYSRVRPDEVSALVDRHFAGAIESQTA